MCGDVPPRCRSEGDPVELIFGGRGFRSAALFYRVDSLTKRSPKINHGIPCISQAHERARANAHVPPSPIKGKPKDPRFGARLPDAQIEIAAIGVHSRPALGLNASGGQCQSKALIVPSFVPS
jgi:hypothetical protein